MGFSASTLPLFRSLCEIARRFPHFGPDQLMAKFLDLFAVPDRFAICAHPSHGSTGCTGPLRTGKTAEEDAQKDADDHNTKHPAHDATTSC